MTAEINTMTLVVVAKNSEQALSIAKDTKEKFASSIDLPFSMVTQVASTEWVVSLSEDESECEIENLKQVDVYTSIY